MKLIGGGADFVAVPHRASRRGTYALTILPALMQLAQTRTFLLALGPTLTLTGRRLTFHRRRVTLCACDTLLPNCGPLPQTSQT